MGCFPPLAPLKPLATTSNVGLELGVGCGSPIDLCMIEGATFIASPADLRLSADRDGAIRSPWAAVSVGVEDILEGFPLL